MFIDIKLSQRTDIDFEFILIPHSLCKFRIQTMNPLNDQNVIGSQLLRMIIVFSFSGLKIKYREVYFLSPHECFHIGIEFLNINSFQALKIIIPVLISRGMLSVHEIIIYRNRMRLETVDSQLYGQSVGERRLP